MGGNVIKHIVMWDFLPELSEVERLAAKETMKALLEPIGELVRGAVEIRVITEGLPSSNKEIALIGTYETKEALETYQNHPAHVEAGKYVRSVTCNRACMDFEE